MKKRILSIFLSATILSTALLAGCNNGGNDNKGSEAVTNGNTVEVTAKRSEDNYRNFYEIFVNSFCDSNNDGVGDFQGVISKLDYLNDGDPTGGDDLGIDGIWFMPIMKSGSYHKYNVEDYCSIDPEYGTMADFEQLMKECDKRGINVIIDLVVNHSSNSHPWFEKACEEVKEGNLDGYAKYYHIVKEADQDPACTYNPIAGTDYFYESNFDVTMPELNLNEPKLREELKKIMQFWVDKGVSGFRLDAVKYFGSGGDDGKDFLTWLHKTGKEIKDDIYMVGEEWSGPGDIQDYYDTKIDSLFNFPMAGSDGKFEVAAKNKNATSFISSAKDWQESIRKFNENAIDAPFLSNHDTPRSSAALGDTSTRKLAAMAYIMSPGNPFIYYGEEVEMGGSTPNKDATYRAPIPWKGEEYRDIIVPGLSNEEGEKTVRVTVDEALKDNNSLLRFYQKLIKIKLENPEIARGTIKEIVKTDDNTVAGYVTEYDGKKIIVMFNMGDTSETVEISKDLADYSGIASQATGLECDENGNFPQSTMDGSKLTIQGSSVVVIR